jgi:hypothetical protein
MKTPLAHQERRLTGLPIPSFSNAVDDVVATATATATASPIHTSTPIPPPPPTTTDTDTTTTTNIEPHWNKDRLLKIEVALQLHVKSQQRTRAATGQLLPLSEFYSFTQKVSSHSNPVGSETVKTATTTATAATTATTTTTTRDSAAETDLSTEERDTYDLLCAASPSLYKLVQMNRQELPAWKYASKVDSNNNNNHSNSAPAAPADETKVWCVEVVPVAGNRMPALHKMLAQTVLEESKSQGILRVIRAYRDDQKKISAAKAQSSVAVDSKPVPVESFLKPGMNIDERVRARADAKEHYREQLEAKAASVSASGGTNTETDRTWLVRLADSLWFHSSHIMKRQDHFQSSKDKKKGSSCVLTLKDIVEVLSRPAATTSSRVPMHVNKSEKLTKREIVKAVQELRDLVPDWIHFVDTKNDKGRLSKDTTVWLKPVDYQNVRARLTGHPAKTTAAAVANTAANTAGQPILKRPPSLSGSRPQPGKSLAQPRPLNKRPFATPAEAGTSLRGSIVTEERTEESLDRFTKKTRVEVPRHENKLPTDYAVAGMKRSAPDVSSTPPVPNKKSRSLRINPNLILTDADYTGGEIIQPTPFDSPRGLKILFSQMNSGKRI